MKLLIDIGNSRIKWACDHGGQLRYPDSVSHRGAQAEAVAEFIGKLAQPPSAAVAVNVAGPALGKAVAEALQQKFGIGLRFVVTTDTCGEVTNGYSAAEQLGADRWAAIVAAWHICRRPACVIDAGTAVTLDIIGEHGHHQGGIIVPGLRLMHTSLNNETSDISGFSQRSDGMNPGLGWVGHDTRSAVEKGILFMLYATVDAAINRLSAAGTAPAVMLTGGDAELLAPLLACPAEHYPLLVLEGVRYLAAEGCYA
ncbi:MAG: type III pantothenate kinase [Gammaproteobacteria bacterium]|jgi:type III pantothenate kinase